MDGELQRKELRDGLGVLVAEYLKKYKLAGTLDALQRELNSIPMADESVPFDPTELIKLEELCLEHVIETTAAKKKKKSKGQASTKLGRRTAMKLPEFHPLQQRDVENTWTEDDAGYQMEVISEEELRQVLSKDGEYEATTVLHESYEYYPKIYEMDEETLAAINDKLELLKKEFPGELQQLVELLGIEHTIAESDSKQSRDRQFNNLLLEHFKEQFEAEAEADGASQQKEDDEYETEQYESYFLKVIQKKNHTGFEETKDFPIVVGSIIAGRYQVQDYLGSAAFSRAIQCYDLIEDRFVCLKIITNNKDFLDQSLDEIKLLKKVKESGSLDEHNLLQIYDYFYHKEHLFIVTELLRDNLYEFYKYNRESGDELYFNIPRLKSIALQILQALDHLHQMSLIHCDLKPENILIKSYSRCLIKVIDLGSSCFITDHLSSYVQSRSYRAPEVILGLPYGQKVDIWSVGCILAELFTGQVLFLNDSLATLLARVHAIIGPVPQHMLDNAIYNWRYYTSDGKLYDRRPEGVSVTVTDGPSILHPKPTTLRHQLNTDDEMFVDFVARLLSVDPTYRPTAAEALTHPWLRDATKSS